MEYIYFETIDGTLIDNVDLVRYIKYLDGIDIDASDFEAIRNHVKTRKGIKREIKHPSIKHLIKHGHKYRAIQIYARNHGIRLMEAKPFIEKIEQELKDKGLLD
jgi:hypothetical protein